MSLRASALILVARAAAGAVSLATVSYLARGLAPEGYALLALATVLAATSSALIIQPLHAALARFVPADLPDAAATLLALFLVALLIMCMLAITACFVAPAGWDRRVILAACALGCCQGVFDFSGQYAAARCWTARYAAQYLIRAVLALVMGMLALGLGGGVWGVVAALCAAYLLAGGMVGRALWAEGWQGRFSRLAWREMQPYVVACGAMLLTSYTMQWGDRLVIAAQVGAAPMGAYAAAGDLVIQSVTLLGTGLWLAWYPRLIAVWETQGASVIGEQGRYYASLVLAVVVAAGAGLVAVAPMLIDTLLGAPYLALLQDVFPWQVGAACLAALRTGVFEMPLHLERRMGRLALNVGLCAALGLLANAVLAQRYGLVAAGWVAVGSQVLGIGLALQATQGRQVLVPARRDLFAALTAALLMVWTVRATAWPGGVAGLVGACLVGAGVFGASFVALNGLGLRVVVGKVAKRIGRRIGH